MYIHIFVMMKIEKEINQRTFRNPFQKAAINVIFTAAWINQRHAQALKTFGISIQQFNILRILRGMRPEPATVKLLTERMIDKMSNASRLVEKLKAKGLVERKSCPEDRRRVNIYITDKGLDLLREASKTIERDEQAYMNSLTDEQASLLSDLLDMLREC